MSDEQSTPTEGAEPVNAATPAEVTPTDVEPPEIDPGILAPAAADEPEQNPEAVQRAAALARLAEADDATPGEDA